MNKNRGLLVAAYSALVAGCLPPASPTPTGEAYRQSPAAGNIRLRSLAWRDAARDRDVPVRVYLPEGRGPFPVVVFSHGVGESQFTYEYLGRHWASNGYVAVHPTHEGSDVRVAIGRNPVTPALREAALNSDNWVNRPLDMSFVLDQLRVHPELSLLIDFDRVAVAGHSLGAHSALALVGLDFRIDGDPAPDLRDSRFTLCIALSPHGLGVFGLDEKSWDQIETPFLSLYGTLDTDIITKDPRTRRAGFDLSARAETVLITIERAEHETFTGRDPRFPFASDAASHQAYIAAMTTAYLDWHMKSAESAQAWLLNGAASDFCDGACLIQRK